MKPIEFAYYLQGFAEISAKQKLPSVAEWKKIRKTLLDVELDGNQNQANYFAIWLKGFVEISEKSQLEHTEWTIIKDHLKLVFDKVTPDRSEGLEQIVKKFKDRPRPKFPDDLLCSSSGVTSAVDPNSILIC